MKIVDFDRKELSNLESNSSEEEETSSVNLSKGKFCLECEEYLKEQTDTPWFIESSFYYS